MVGTFYVRVVAVTPCGNADVDRKSPSRSLRSSATSRAHPIRRPGTLLPKPTYGQDVVIAMAQQYGFDLRNSCEETGGNHVFMFRVVNALRQRDSRWGMNQKRGNQGLSQDIATYNPTSLPDAQAQQIYLWDMIGGHCGGNPTWNWGDVTAATWQGGADKWQRLRQPLVRAVVHPAAVFPARVPINRNACCRMTRGLGSSGDPGGLGPFTFPALSEYNGNQCHRIHPRLPILLVVSALALLAALAACRADPGVVG